MPVAKVLVVDDEESVRTSIGKILELHEFRVTLAANASEALRLVESETFDAILSDLRMPGPGDGLTTIQAMRTANPSALTLLMSAYPDVDASPETIALRADEIIPKPINIPGLIRLLKERLQP